MRPEAKAQTVAALGGDIKKFETLLGCASPGASQELRDPGALLQLHCCRYV
jgi:hypothetical protein